MQELENEGSVAKGCLLETASAMAIAGCQFDCIWNKLQSRNEGHTVIWILRQENNTPLT